MPNCQNCNQAFTVTQADSNYLQEISPVFNGQKILIPPPQSCQSCRMQHRLMFRNQQNLYRRTCDHSKKPIISIYSPDKTQRIYDPEVWWSDQWDALSFGFDYDFSRPFQQNFKKLMRAVPHLGVLKVNCQNSDYTNQSYSNRDCYLSSAIKECEGALYCQNSNHLTDSLDSSFCFDSQLLYQCADCFSCYNCAFASHSINCQDSYWLDDCIGCKQCFGCKGLRNKEYHYFKQPLKKEEYGQKIAAHKLQTFAGQNAAISQFDTFLQKLPNVYAWIRNCENSTGNNLRNCRNCTSCFDCQNLEDCRYCTWVFESKDCLDCYGMGGSELVYESMGVEEVQRVLFSFGTSMSNECLYTDLCFNCQHCFGCSGLKHKEYCVFNKQYSEADYAALATKIISHMQQTGEWGQFFHPAVSAFAYNESKAQEYLPLTREQAAAKGFLWKDDIDALQQAAQTIPADRLPDDIAQIPDDLLNWAVICFKSQRPYRIVKKELEFYRQHSLPVPRLHPDVRLQIRQNRRNPQFLWRRKCGQCGQEVASSYSPDRTEIIYCEECYMKEVYQSEP